jgi:MFS transporter, FHS family, glucose/mannose:H+ symporter
VSGLLLALPGALLPVWGYHITSDFPTIGLYLASLGAGLLAGGRWGPRLLPGRERALPAIACALGSAALLLLAFAGPPIHPGWRMAGLALAGLSAGLLHTTLFGMTLPSGHPDQGWAASLEVAGIFFGMGCLAAALLVRMTFYLYPAQGVLLLAAIPPAVFALVFARQDVPAGPPEPDPPLAGEPREFGPALFLLLLTVQFANEWSIAQWLPLFLIQRLGTSPETALLVLTLFWMALLAGRVGALGMLASVGHGRLLLASVLAAASGCGILLATNNVFGASMGVLLLGAGFASIHPLIAEKAAQRFPGRTAAFFRDLFGLALTGGMLAAAALAYAAEVWGIGAVMWMPMAGSTLVFALVLLAWLETKVTAG